MNKLLTIPLIVFSSFTSAAPLYETVINHGRVIDPLTGLDAIRHIGIEGDRIVNISEKPLSGEKSIDASGLIVAPGFIDYHWHCPTQTCYEIGLKDGLTSALDLEFGTFGPRIADWYAARETRARINFGTSSSVELARAHVIDGNTATDTTDAYISRGRGNGWAEATATYAQQEATHKAIKAGLDAGAVGIGLTLGYMPGLSAPEVYEIQALAAAYGRQACVHLRHTPGNTTGEVNGAQEILANAVALKAPACINHFNNAGWGQVQTLLTNLRAQGFNVWGDVYPYEAGSTSINAVFFRPEILEDKLGWKYEERLYDPELNRFLSKQDYLELVESDPVRAVIIYKSSADEIIEWLQLEGVVIASDGMPLFGEWDDKHEELPNTHPRRAGTRAKSLRLAREHDLDMVKMIAALSTNAAIHLGNTGLKAMQERGRIQKGMIADLTLFDPGTVTDNANYANGLPTSTGVEYVLVSGQIALERGEVVEATRAGKALKFESNNR